MFELISNGFKEASLKFKGQSTFNEENMAPALDVVKRALLNGDVDFKVTKDFLENVKIKCLGEVVKIKSKSGNKIRIDDHFIKICHDEITDLLGGNSTQIIKNTKGPTVIMLVGLQGAGKTTHAAKIARLLSQNPHKMRPLLIAADVYRPAAKDQLKILGEKLNIPVFTMDDSSDALEIAKKGLEYARQEWLDLVIIDTAGRLAIDEPLMKELHNIKDEVKPQNILLVLDAMIGQDAVRTASAFDSLLNLTGVILTKLDGDTRGGAALSIKKVTNKNILFVGTGETLDKLEEFRPEGMASRILGMGDIVGLVDDFHRAVDEEEMEKQQSRLMSGKFDFNDMENMLQTMKKMGSAKDIMSKIPIPGLDQNAINQVSDKEVFGSGPIIQSMTKKERENPELLLSNKSPNARGRISRIAKGCAKSEKAVKDLVDQFFHMKSMVDMMSGFGFGGNDDGFMSKIPGLNQLKKMSGMAKMAKMMGGAGGGGLGDLSSMFGGAMPNFGGGDVESRGFSTSDLAEINRMKKRKKEEKLRKQKKR